MICARSFHTCARSCEATPAADLFRRCRRRVDTRRRRCAEDCLVGRHEGDPGKSKIQHGRNALDALDHAGGNCGEQHFGRVEGIGGARKPSIQSDLRHFGMSNTFVQCRSIRRAETLYSSIPINPIRSPPGAQPSDLRYHATPGGSRRGYLASWRLVLYSRCRQDDVPVARSARRLGGIRINGSSARECSAPQGSPS